MRSVDVARLLYPARGAATIGIYNIDGTAHINTGPYYTLAIQIAEDIGIRRSRRVERSRLAAASAVRDPIYHRQWTGFHLVLAGA